MSEVSNDFFEWRKNWLFSHCERGARANAVPYSIIETAKENMLKPYEYIKWILESLKNMSFESFEDFLPWGDKIPDNLKVPVKPRPSSD